MKKTLCLVLALVMAMSLNSVAFAENAVELDKGLSAGSTEVKYEAGAETWTLSVPDTMAPGDTKDVTFTGTYSNKYLATVTFASDTVTLTAEGINGEKKLGVSFDAGLAVAGHSDGQVSGTQEVTVQTWEEANEAKPLVGTWTGTINYVVTFTKLPDTQGGSQPGGAGN